MMDTSIECVDGNTPSAEPRLMMRFLNRRCVNQMIILATLEKNIVTYFQDTIFYEQMVYFPFK